MARACYGPGTAVPVMGTVCVFPGVAEIVNVVLKVPVPSVFGLKARETVQLAPPSRRDRAGVADDGVVHRIRQAQAQRSVGCASDEYLPEVEVHRRVEGQDAGACTRPMTSIEVPATWPVAKRYTEVAVQGVGWKTTPKVQPENAGRVS